MVVNRKHCYYYSIRIECTRSQYMIYKESLEDEIIMFNSYYSNGLKMARFCILCDGRHEMSIIKEIFNFTEDSIYE